MREGNRNQPLRSHALGAGNGGGRALPLLLGRVLGRHGAVLGVEDELVSVAGPRAGARAALAGRGGRGRPRTPHVGAQEDDDDGGVEDDDHLRGEIARERD